MYKPLENPKCHGIVTCSDTTDLDLGGQDMRK